MDFSGSLREGGESERPMARADLLLNMVKAGIRGDLPQFRKTVEAVAADERAKNHGILTDRLIAQIKHNGNGNDRNATVSSPIPARYLTNRLSPARPVSVSSVIPTLSMTVFPPFPEAFMRLFPPHRLGCAA